MSEKIYVFKIFERIWHWSQAFLIIALLLTGFEVHGSYKLFGYESAVNTHTMLAWTLVGLWVFAIFWHITTGEWKHYIPTLQNVDAIIVDMHAEATSEKMGMGLALDSKVSAVVGSHTHVPTNDCRILMGGTAYQTDAGMCGDYNSVIGFNPAAPMDMFRSKIRKQRMEPATGEGTLSAVLIETDDTTGFAKSITPIMRGGILGN